LAFQIQVSSPPVSHRSPSHFQSRFETFPNGLLVHLGNKDCKPDGFFFASDLLDESWYEDQPKYFRFRDEVTPAVFKLLHRLELTSVSQEIYFTSDYQFSENAPHRQSFLRA
jgi:hypothetical protein